MKEKTLREFEIWWKSYKAGYPSYQEVADWFLTRRAKEFKDIAIKFDKAFEQLHGGGNGKRILLQLKDLILNEVENE